MADEPLLTLEQLATVLKVPEALVRGWQQQGILPVGAAEPNAAAVYSRREVVQTLRKYPEIMTEIKTAMRRNDDEGA